MFWTKYVALCTKAGKSPNVVASEIGIKSTGTVTGWKNGALPRNSVLLKIATYFGVSVEYLTQDDNEKKSAPLEGSGHAQPMNERERALIQIARELDPERQDLLLRIAAVVASRDAGYTPEYPVGASMSYAGTVRAGEYRNP